MNALAVPLWETPTATLIDDACALVERMQRRYKPTATLALFSGGHDSTIMLHAVRDLIDYGVHVNTGIGIPATSQFVRDTCAALGVPLIEAVTPPDVYDRLVLDPASLRVDPEDTEVGPGFPGASAHGPAYYYLKQKRLREVRARFVTRRGERVLFVTGIRSDESGRRTRGDLAVPVKREGSIVWVNPVLTWTAHDQRRYRETHPDCPRNEVADLLHRSGECLCGAMAHSSELDEIALWYPEVAARIRALEAQVAALGVRNCRWGGQNAPRSAAPVGPLCSGCTLFDASLSVGTAGTGDTTP